MERKQENNQIQEFKNFINNHPKLLEYVRSNGYSWQQYYEKWVLLGEKDPYWDQYRFSNRREFEDNPATEKALKQLGHFVNNINVSKVQKQVNELNNIISTIDGLLKKYLESKGEVPSSPYDFFGKYRD